MDRHRARVPSGHRPVEYCPPRARPELSTGSAVRRGPVPGKPEGTCYVRSEGLRGGRGLGQVVGGDVPGFAAERELPAGCGHDGGRQRQPIQQDLGHYKVEAGALGVLLEPGRGVQDVADEHDLLPQIAQLAGRDGTAVQAAAEAGHGAEIALVARSTATHDRADRKEAADAVGLVHACLGGPGDHDLVARILVDLRPGFEDRLGQVVHELAQQLEVARAAQALGELRGALEVEEQEDAVLPLGPMIDAGHEVAQDVGADDADHLEKELDRDRQEREVGQRVDEVRLGKAGEEATWVQARDHQPDRAANEKEAEHDHAADDQIRPEAQPPEPWTQSALAEEQQVAPDQQRDERGVDQALDRGSDRPLAGEHVEDGRDHADDDHDDRELSSLSSGPRCPHAAASISYYPESPTRKRPFWPSGPWNLQKNCVDPDDGTVSSSSVRLPGTRSRSTPRAGTLRLWSVPVRFSTDSRRRWPARTRTKVGVK